MVAPPILLWSLLGAGGMAALAVYLLFPDGPPPVGTVAKQKGQGSNTTISESRKEPTVGVTRRRQTSKNKSTS